MDFNPEPWITFAIRLTNAILWSIVGLQVLRRDRSLVRFARQMIIPVIVAGMWMLVIGSLTSLGLLEGSVARTLYTVYTAAAAVIALTLVTSNPTD